MLIVEDSAAYAENLVEVLTDDGYDVEHATSVAGAMDAARRKPFDLALVDVRLPDVAGTDALPALKELSPSSELIVMSGDATLDSALAAVRGGAFAYLLKPVLVDELLRLMAVASEQVALRREREQLMSRLEASDARYRGLVETSSALILGVGGDGSVTMFNGACEACTGFARDEVVGRPFSELLPPRVGGAPSRPIDGVMTLRTKGGTDRTVHWRRTEIEGTTYAVGIDLTEHLALEERMRAAERLASAGQLTAGLAHEVRNPLNAALLELKVHERALSRIGFQEGLESVAIIRSELERLRRLTQEFLELARPVPSQQMPGDLRESVDTVMRLVAAESIERGVDVSVDHLSGAVWARFDSARIRQVLLNLVTNAMEVTPTGGHIVLRTKNADGHVHLEVEDSGPGIPEPERVFDPFFTTKPAGTGLGLTIARRIILDHRGQIRVTSRPGKTVFTISLPRIEPADDE